MSAAIATASSREEYEASCGKRRERDLQGPSRTEKPIFVALVV